jgi:coenzyme F420-0:L-glutamate ligase/coenzyme F420-1:gamma-L-glutamate ligase
MARERQEARLIALAGVPLVQAGDNLCAIILHAVAQSGESLQAGDVLVIAQKIVSKAQARYVELADIIASEQALRLAEVVQKDPRMIELILRESTEVLRVRRDVIIVVHRSGFVMANAGIDYSNVAADTADERVLLLPADPDGTCERLREQLQASAQVAVSVIINDSHGRAWRNGTVGVAIGASGGASTARPARRARPVRAYVAHHSGRVCRRAGCRRVAVDGAGRRRHAHRLDTRRTVASARRTRRRPRASQGAGLVPLAQRRSPTRLHGSGPAHRRFDCNPALGTTLSGRADIDATGGCALEAAIAAPSPHNRQPWRFVVIEAPATKAALAQAHGDALAIRSLA